MRRMSCACWKTKATDTHTHTKYVALLVFPRYQWLQERALLGRFMRTWRILNFYVCSKVKNKRA
jgi:hypothetical protein